MQARIGAVSDEANHHAEDLGDHEALIELALTGLFLQGRELDIQDELMTTGRSDETDMQVVLSCIVKRLDCVNAVFHHPSDKRRPCQPLYCCFKAVGQ